MEKFVYAFTKEEGLIFEVVTNEGDNMYWADQNGGVQLSSEHILSILNGRYSAEEMVVIYGNV